MCRDPTITLRLSKNYTGRGATFHLKHKTKALPAVSYKAPRSQYSYADSGDGRHGEEVAREAVAAGGGVASAVQLVVRFGRSIRYNQNPLERGL